MDAKIDILRVKDTNGSEYAVYPKTLIKCVTNENGDNLEDTMRQFITDNLDAEVASKEYVAEQIAGASHLTREIVTEIPNAETAKDNVIYMLKVESVSGNDMYQEYQLINGEVVMVGDTSVDLSGYVQSETVEAIIDGTTPVGNANKLGGKDASEYVQGVSPYFVSGETILSWASNPNGVYKKFVIGGVFPSDVPTQAEGFVELKIDEQGLRRKVTFYQFGTFDIYEREIFNGAWRADWSKSLATTADLANYLPLSGGVVNGHVTFNGGVGGAEGGEVFFTKPPSGSNFNNNLTMDVYADNVRLFAEHDGVLKIFDIDFNSMTGAHKALHTGNVGDYALPLTGGTINGPASFREWLNIYADSSGTNTYTSLIEYANATHLRHATDANNYDDVTVKQGEIVYQKLVNGAFSENTLLHSGNIGEYALPKSGGTLSSSAGCPLEVKSTDTNYPNIQFTGASGSLGNIGFMGIGLPTIWIDKDGATSAHTLLHSGNIGEYTAKNALGVRSHEHDAVNCTNMTIPQLKATLETWANSDAVNVSDFNVYTTRVGLNFVNLWNSGDTTSTCGWGGWWYWYKLGADRTTDFAKFLVCGYQGTDIYYVEVRQGVWSNLRPLLHTENISSYIGVASISEVPAGSYVGNGSARTINTDGNGKSCIITGNNGSVTVDEYGGVGHDSNGNVVGVSMDTMKFVDGILTMSADCAYNVTGVVYNYKVL